MKTLLFLLFSLLTVAASAQVVDDFQDPTIRTGLETSAADMNPQFSCPKYHPTTPQTIADMNGSYTGESGAPGGSGKGTSSDLKQDTPSGATGN